MASARRRSALSLVHDVIASPVTGLSAAALIWSGNMVVGRALRDSISPLSLNFWRWTVALAILLPLSYGPFKLHRPLLLRHWKRIAALGLTGIAAFHTCVYRALATTSAVNALLLLSLAPLLIILLSWSVHGERLSPRQLLGACISFLGAIALIARGSIGSLTALNFGAGDLWMLLAVVLWAIYSLLLKRVPAELPQLALLSANATAAVLLMLPVYLWKSAGEPAISLSTQTVGGVLYMSVFASGFAFLLWNRGVARIGPSRAGTFIYLMPAFGAVLSFAFLGEAVQSYESGGCALIFLGIAAMNWKSAPPSTQQIPFAASAVGAGIVPANLVKGRK